MTTPARFVRFLGITGLVCWLGMIGWVAKSSQAQNGGQTVPALPVLKDAPGGRVESKSALPLPPPIAPAEAVRPAHTSEAAAVPAPVPVQTPDSQPTPAQPKQGDSLALPGPEAEPPAQLKTQAAEPVISRPAAEATSVAANEDPELSAKNFVERNEKEAEDRLKALTAEADQLRARLNKLESGIKKWENLVNALKTAQQGPVTSTAVTAGAEDAGDLEPIRTGAPGAARSEKRVKWATAPGSGNIPAASGAEPLPAAAPAEPAASTAADAPPQAPPARPVQATAPSVIPR